MSLPIRISKPWGYEIIWAQTNLYVGKILHIEAGKRLSLQYHERKDESIYVLKGELQLDIETESLKVTKCMQPGETYHIQPGCIHRMTGITECEVLEVSTPELSDVIRIEDDYHRLKE